MACNHQDGYRIEPLPSVTLNSPVVHLWNELSEI